MSVRQSVGGPDGSCCGDGDVRCCGRTASSGRASHSGRRGERRDERAIGRDRRRLEWRERRRRTNGDAEKGEDENDVEKGEEAAKVAVEKGFDAVNKHQHAHGQENHTEQNHLQGDRGFATVLHHNARVVHTLRVSSNSGDPTEC